MGENLVLENLARLLIPQSQRSPSAPIRSNSHWQATYSSRALVERFTIKLDFENWKVQVKVAFGLKYIQLQLELD